MVAGGGLFRDRSVVEVMVLAFTFVIASAIIILGTAIAVVEIVNPNADTSGAATALFNIITGMMGALLGLLAGKSEMGSLGSRPPVHPPTDPLYEPPPEHPEP
jgi:hypothetical protein